MISTSNGTTIDVLIQALETQGLVRRLAEPNLITLSGDPARFLAGGELKGPYGHIVVPEYNGNGVVLSTRN